MRRSPVKRVDRLGRLRGSERCVLGRRYDLGADPTGTHRAGYLRLDRRLVAAHQLLDVGADPTGTHRVLHDGADPTGTHRAGNLRLDRRLVAAHQLLDVGADPTGTHRVLHDG